MKKIFVLLLSLGFVFGASAQRGHFVGGGGFHGGFHGGGHVVVVPRTYVGLGFGLGYPWGYPYGWYGAYGYPYPPYYYGYGAMPSQLELQVRDIRTSYDQEIKDVKHDKSLTKQERRAKVDQLKKDREDAIVQARHDYFDRSRRNYNPPATNPPASKSDGPEPEYQNGGGTGDK